MDEIDRAIQKAECIGDKALLASAYNIRGMNCIQLNEYRKAISDFDDAIEIMEDISNKGMQLNENELAKAYAGRGMAYTPEGENIKAKKDFDKSVDIWERLQRENKPFDENLLPLVYAIRSSIIIKTSENTDEAIWGSEKSIEIAERLHIDDEITDFSILATNYFIMGNSYDQKGINYEQNGDKQGQIRAFKEANSYYSKCIEAWSKLYNSGGEVDYDSLASAYMNRGSNYYHEMNEIDLALSDHNMAVFIREKLQEEGSHQDPFDMFMVYKNRSQTYEAKGDVESAIKDVIPAMRVLKKSFSSIRDFQPMYYDVLGELIELIEKVGDKALLQRNLEEFLYTMHHVPKLPDAEVAHKHLENNYPQKHQ